MPARKFVGRLMLYIGTGGDLLIENGSQCMIIDRGGTRELFDYLLEYARYFQASNRRLVDSEPLRQQARMERE